MLRPLLRLWELWFADAVRRVEAESLAYRLSDAGRGFDRKTVVVLLTAAACLTFQRYATLLTVPLAGWFTGGPSSAFAQNVQWAAAAVFSYAVVPAVVVRCVFRERVRDYGVKLAGLLAGWPLYLGFVAVMVPLVWACSAGTRFQQTYPFYQPASAADWPELVQWELLYAAQFAALEFFFRGFLVHGTRHRFGAYSVVVMTVPYCMIHFAKPPAECVASIVAGLVLGLMSLKTRSVWLGAALHVTVAWGMDAACLWRTGFFAGDTGGAAFWAAAF